MKAEQERIFESIGAFKATRAIGSFVNAASYALSKQMKDVGAHKLLGMDWKTFCKERLGADQKTINGEIEFLEQYGESFLLAAQRIGLTKKHLLQLGTLEDGAKAVIEGDVITIGDSEFKFDEIAEERADEFKKVLSLYTRELEVTRKELKQATKKLDGIDGEQKKSEKALLKKIADLEAVIKPDTPEKLEEAFLVLDKMLEDYDNTLRALVWKQPWVKDDPAAQAKVEALQTRAEKRFEHFRGDWDAFCSGE